jgi:hypothetical protein
MTKTHWTESDNPDRIGLHIGLRVLLAVVVMVGLCWGGYLLWLRVVEGPAITQHAHNIRHSLNFTQAANMRAESMIPDYDAAVEAQDTTHASSLRSAICSAAGSIDPSEQSADVRTFAETHCVGGQ